MLCQLSYAVKSVRVDDISELSLVPSISVWYQCVKIWYLCVLVLCTQVNRMFVVLPCVCIQETLKSSCLHICNYVLLCVSICNYLWRYVAMWCVATCDLLYVRMYCYVLLCEDVLLCAACDYVFVCATMPYYELISETMCYYVLLCASICNYLWRCVAMCDDVLLRVICYM